MVANDTPAAVGVYHGRGDGTFTALPSVPLRQGCIPKWVGVADFDRDTRLDVAVTETNSNFMAILRGNGDGTFKAPSEFATAATPVAAAAGDFDRDNRIDLAIACSGANAVNVLLNRSQ